MISMRIFCVILSWWWWTLLTSAWIHIIVSNCWSAVPLVCMRVFPSNEVFRMMWFPNEDSIHFRHSFYIKVSFTILFDVNNKKSVDMGDSKKSKKPIYFTTWKLKKPIIPRYRLEWHSEKEEVVEVTNAFFSFFLYAHLLSTTVSTPGTKFWTVNTVAIQQWKDEV